MPIGKKGSCLWCGNQCDVKDSNICSTCLGQWNDKTVKPAASPFEDTFTADALKKKPAPVEPEPLPEPERQVRETPKILVIDDEPHIARLLSSRLQANGYDVVTAANGAEGLKMTLLEEPDLIIADIMMPKMTGYEFLKTLRSQEDIIRDTPVIIITAKHSMREFFDNWNIVSFVTKPFRPAELLEIIRRRLGREAA